MGIEELVKIMDSNGIEQISLDTSAEATGAERSAKYLESSRRREEAVSLRLALALFYYGDGRTEDAVYQVSKAGKAAFYISKRLKAELRNFSADEFLRLARRSPYERKLLNEACFDFIYAAEAYFEIGDITHGQECLEQFLIIANEITFRSEHITSALKNIRPYAPSEIEGYCQVARVNLGAR